MLEGDAVDLVVDVKTLDVLPMGLHDDIDEVVDSAAIIPEEDFAVEDLVVPEDVEDHFFVDFFGWRLEVDFHSPGLFLFEIDVSLECERTLLIYTRRARTGTRGVKTYGGSLFRRIPTASNSASS